MEKLTFMDAEKYTLHTRCLQTTNSECIIWGGGTGAVHKWISHTCLHVVVKAPPSDRLRCVETSRKIIWLDYISIIVTRSQRSTNFYKFGLFRKFFFVCFQWTFDTSCDFLSAVNKKQSHYAWRVISTVTELTKYRATQCVILFVLSEKKGIHWQRLGKSRTTLSFGKWKCRLMNSARGVITSVMALQWLRFKIICCHF